MCTLVSRVLFYFLSASQPLGFQRLRLSNGAKLAKLRPAGPEEAPVARLGLFSLSGENTVMKGITKQSHLHKDIGLGGDDGD